MFNLIWLIDVSDKIDLPIKWRQKLNYFLKFLEYFWLLLVILLLTLLHFFPKNKMVVDFSTVSIVFFILSSMKLYLSGHLREIFIGIFLSDYVPLRYRESIMELEKEIKNWDKKLDGDWRFLIKNKKSNFLDWIGFNKKKILTTFKTIDDFSERFADAVKFFLTRAYVALSAQYFLYFLIFVLITSLIKRDIYLLFGIPLSRIFAFGIIKEILYTDLQMVKIIGYNNWKSFVIATKNSKELLGIYIENKNIVDKILFFILSWPLKLSLEKRENFLKIKLIESGK